jgi:N-acetyltransferase 10
LVLQDYEAITPNLLARTIETVEGGGVVVLLLKTMSSLKQLYSMSMVSQCMVKDVRNRKLIAHGITPPPTTQDVHARYRTEAHHDVQPRFNERFILSLGSCSTCLVLDDELNVLPISAGKDISADPSSSIIASTSKAATELSNLKASLADTPIVGPLAKLCATTDQLRGLLTFAQSGIASKTLSSTISLTAGRGRGKSAALGLAIAAAVAHDYSNIFVTSPTPENLKTLFEFVAKGLNAMGYEETLDYEVVRTGNEDWGRAVVRINIFKGHRQTIQVRLHRD